MINKDSRIQWYSQEMNIINMTSIESTFSKFSWMVKEMDCSGNYKINFEKNNYDIKITDLCGWTDLLSIERVTNIPSYLSLYLIKRDSNEFDLTLNSHSSILCLNTKNSHGSIKNIINEFVTKSIINLTPGELIQMGVEEFKIEFANRIPIRDDHTMYILKTKSGSFNTEGFRLCCIP